MEESLKELENCTREYEATLSYEDLTPHFEEAILQYRKKVTMPGFRKGKAPIGMVKKMYGESIEYSSSEEIANKIFAKYIKENEVDIVEQGSLVDLDYKPKESLTFKVQFEVRPEVEINNIDGLELKNIKYEVDDSFVDAEVKYHQYQHSSFEMDGEAFDDEYLVTVDVNNLDDDGNLIIGQSEKDVKIYLNNKELLPEFKSALQGIKENDERIIETKNKDGKLQKIKLTATKIEKVVPPELNEDFFKKVTNKDDVKNEEDFRKLIKDDLENFYNNESKKKLKSDVVKVVVENNPIPVPEAYIQRILDQMIKDYEAKVKTSLNDSQKEEVRKSSRPVAHEQASWYMIREKIIESEKLELTDEDYAEHVKEGAKRFNIPEDKLLEVYKNNPSLMENILTDKVIDYIISKSNLTEEVKKLSDVQNTETQN